MRFSTVSPRKNLSTIGRTLKVTLNGIFHVLAESRRNFTKKNAPHCAESKRDCPQFCCVRFLLLSHAGLSPAAQKKHFQCQLQAGLAMETPKWLLAAAQGVSRVKSIPVRAGDANRAQQGGDAAISLLRHGTLCCFMHSKCARRQTEPHGLLSDLTENVLFQSPIKNMLPHVLLTLIYSKWKKDTHA